MTRKSALRALFQVIEDEADRNPDFADRLHGALGSLAADAAVTPAMKPPGDGAAKSGPSRARNRRAAAVLDPVALARQGEAPLREALAGLSVEQLKDIIAQHGMDPGKVTTRWRSADKLIGHIVTLALMRSRKGDAFL